MESVGVLWFIALMGVVATAYLATLATRRPYGSFREYVRNRKLILVLLVVAPAVCVTSIVFASHLSAANDRRQAERQELVEAWVASIAPVLSAAGFEPGEGDRLTDSRNYSFNEMFTQGSVRVDVVGGIGEIHLQLGVDGWRYGCFDEHAFYRIDLLSGSITAFKAAGGCDTSFRGDEG